MSKEMFISSSPHETRVAVCEDDLLVEFYIERDTDVGLVGGIYKGRVNRVLPGMQSAFVDIGLERDAFLYVSDFSLPGEEFEGVFDEVESRAPAPLSTSATEESHPAPHETDRAFGGAPPAAVIVSPPQVKSEARPAAAEIAPAENPPTPPPPSGESGAATPASTSAPGENRGLQRPHQDFRGGRRRRHRGRGGYSENRFSRPRQEEPRRPQERFTAAPSHSPFEILPGESLAKYRQSGGPSSAESAPSAVAEPVLASHEASPETTPPEPSKPAVTASVLEAPAVPDVQAAPPAETEGRGQEEQASASFSQPSEALAVEETTLEPAMELGDEAEPEESPALETGEPTEGVLEGPAAEAAEPDAPVSAATSEEAAPAAPAPSSPAAETTDRQYTLREPHQRPHFAPRRRRRGRRGMRDDRPAPRGASPRSGNNQPVQISELLKEGQEILVQIAKEPLGTKGARITSHVALPGRFLVYMPTITHIGVSRKVTSEQERLRLRNTILEHRGSLTGGFIVRTAAEGRSEEEIKADLRFLTTLWNDIRAKAERSKAPAIIYRDLDLVQRLLRDTLTPEFKSVRVDNEAEYERILELISHTQPAMLPNVKLHTRDTLLFDEYGVSAEIEKALRPKVWLKSGGYIVINQTEALVAIDVNTGKYVGKTNRLEDTILKTNIDAVKEIVRQIRLRDLGGIIVIDFIDMDERRNRNRVVQALEEALRHDRAPTKVLSFNEFGLVALTRKRVKQSLQRTLSEPCAYCNGGGWVKSVTTVSNEILAEARKMAEGLDGKTLTLRVHPEVAKFLKSRDAVLISEIESMTHKDVVIKSDPSIHQEQFEIF